MLAYRGRWCIWAGHPGCEQSRTPVPNWVDTTPPEAPGSWPSLGPPMPAWQTMIRVSGSSISPIRSSPTSMGSIGTTGNAVAVAMSGNLAYVAASSAGLRIINLSNPAAPVEVGFYDTSWHGPGLWRSGAAWPSSRTVRRGSTSSMFPTRQPPCWSPHWTPLGWPARPISWAMPFTSRMAYGFLIEDLATCSTAPPVAFSFNSPAPGALATPCGLTLDWDRLGRSLPVRPLP